MDIQSLKQEYVVAGGGPDPARFDYFMRFVEQANQLAEGDYIEVGTLWGITLRLIHGVMDQSRTLYSFDTFDGFDQRDLEVERIHLPDHYWTAGSSLTPAEDHCFFHTSVERVRDYLGNPANLRLVKGWFPESFNGHEHIHWRFAHIDVDLYQPTKCALELIWPRLVPGGIVMVHDFGMQCFAANKAVIEFCETRGLRFGPLDDYHRSVMLRKEA